MFRITHAFRRGPIARTALALAALLCAGAAPAGGLDPASAAAAREDSTDQLIIKYRAGSAARTRADLQTMSRAHEVMNRAGVQMRVLQRSAFNAMVMKLDRRLDATFLDGLARSIAADPDVEYAEADRVMRVQLTPNDPRYLDQWHYYEAAAGVRAPPAWDRSTGSGVVVAVIDTGYRPHADLAANIVGGHDMIIDTAVSNDGNGRDSDARDPGDWVSLGECGLLSPAQGSSWHGTHVAGTVAAVTNNAAGVAGVAFRAKVLPVRVLGKCGGYTSDIAAGITWASGGAVPGVPANAHRARVINLSLGGSGSCGTTMQSAINGARSRGTAVVVAAGNSNQNASGHSPANCAGVIAVAALNRSGGRSYFSNFGSIVDIAAPGGDMRSAATNGVLSTLNSGSTTPGADVYAHYQGTSMAAPHVAAVAALMIARNPALTPDQVESRLKSSARPFPASCSQCGAGVVNADAAVVAAGGSGATVAEVESNNTIATAQPIAANPATVNGRLSSSSDTDYFAVTVGAGRTLTVTLTPPSTADYDLYLYNGSGTELAKSVNDAGLVDSLSYRNASSGSATLYARVRYWNGGAGNYTVRLSSQ